LLYTDITNALKEIFNDENLAVTFNVPPKKEFGDFSSAICMAMAKTLKKAPVAIANEAKNALLEKNVPYLKNINVTPPGYLNFEINYENYAKDLILQIFSKGDYFGESEIKDERKILIEHTNVNPNKAMHIGHLRNSVIGDSVVRTLRKLGKDVQACNYIDDTGVQVADVVVAMLYLEQPFYRGENDFSEIWGKVNKNISFDYWCWDIYSRISNAYEQNPELKTKRAEILHAVEAQNNNIAIFAKEVATKIVKAHLATVSRLNVYYDLLNWESDIFLRNFWITAFDKLKSSGAVVFEEEGPNKGCWVVKCGQGIVETDEGIKSEDKVLVRSNGTVTYTGKDIAYQMWKFGILGIDFLYKEWDIQKDGKPLITTAPNGKECSKWGNANEVINVIDCRQSYTQQIVYECLEKLGYEKEAENSIHLGYEVVVLSNTAAKELGMEVDENSGIQAMSGRKGLGVKGDDLINILKEKMSEKVKDEKSLDVLACAALRYFMSKITTGKMIVFDFEEALKTTGDSGVYCEYAHARASSILAKAEIIDFSNVNIPEKVSETEKDLIKKIAEYPDILKKAGEELSPAPLAHYAFELASTFTSYYENPDPEAEKRVAFINIEDLELKKYRLSLVKAFKQVIKNCLDTLGIEAIEKI